jgi:hypothetical protein
VRKAIGGGYAVVAGRAGAAAGFVRGGRRRGQLDELAVGALSGSSGVLTAPGRFDLVGVSWLGPGVTGVQLRVRRDGGWSEWVNAAARGHGPDYEAPGARTVGEPVWAGGADAVEVRSAAPLRGVSLHLVNARLPAGAGGGIGLARSRYAAPVYPAGPGQPKIIARHVWANAACRPRVRAGIGDVRLGFVHHTQNANSYSRSESAAMVQAICLFHRNVNGWNDIGYNFLVDRFGQIFEGRAGGIDEPIVGAQAGGYNLASTGVGVLGNFISAAPSAAAQAAVEHVLAWKLSLHGVPAEGEVDVVVNAAGAPYSKYPAGADVPLQRISGHRDADSTDCPGDAMYRRLPELRRRVATLAGDIGQLSMSGPPAPVAGTPANVAGTLAIRDGAPIGGAQIAVKVHDRGRNRIVATAVTAPDGTWSAAVAAPHRVALRALFAGDGAHPAVISPYLLLAFAPAMTLVAGAPGIVPLAGQPLPVSGTVTPAKRFANVELLQGDALGAFTRVTVVKVPVAANGAFSGAVTPPAPGSYRLVAHTDADKLNGAGVSAPVDVVVG